MTLEEAIKQSEKYEQEFLESQKILDELLKKISEQENE